MIRPQDNTEDTEGHEPDANGREGLTAHTDPPQNNTALPFIDNKTQFMINKGQGLWHKTHAITQIKPQLPANSARQPTAEQLQYMHQLFREPNTEHYTQWTGTEQPEQAQFNLTETIEAARLRFSKADIAATAIQRAAAAEQPDRATIWTNSRQFEIDPLGTITARAHEFSDTRINHRLLDDPMIETTTPELRQRLQNITKPLDPIMPPDFIPLPTAATIRPQMAAVQTAINALTWISYQKGENLTITNDSWKAALDRHNLNGHTSEVHMRDKESDIGRLLWDYRNQPGYTPVNGTKQQEKLMKQLCKDTYGSLEYPTYCDYIQLFWNAQHNFPNQQLEVAKTDVTRGYHRLQWTPTGALLLAIRTAPELVTIPLTLGFGKRESPYAFGPIGDYLDHCHRQRLQQQQLNTTIQLKPTSRTYVDDTTTFGTPAYLRTEEIPAQEQQIRRSIYEGAVNTDKRKISSREDVLGIRTDTITARAGISHKGYQKLLYIYYIILPRDITIQTKIPLKAVQATASLAHHYGKLIPLLRHTASVYYQALKGPTDQPRTFKTAQVNAVSLWRDYLAYAHDHANVLASSMHDIFYNDPIAGPPEPPLRVSRETHVDATPETLGIYVAGIAWLQIELNEITDTTTTIAHAELLAFLIGYTFTVFVCHEAERIHIHIDNQNAQHWSAGHIRTTEPIANLLTCLNAYLQTAFAVDQTRSYINTKDNINADNISRRSFNDSNRLTRYSAGPALKTSFGALLRQPESTPSQIVAKLLTLWDSEASPAFSVYQSSD